jgi:hypothetical protein
VKRAPARSQGDDKKLQQTLKKLNVQPIQAIEEVNMFKSDGNVIHFAAPKGEFVELLRLHGAQASILMLTSCQFTRLSRRTRSLSTETERIRS